MMIDMSKWKEFRVGDILDCETTLGIPSKNDLKEGDINYITRSAIGNGFSGTCGNESHRNKGNCITIGAEGFIAFWQNEDFVAGNKVYALRHPKMNETNGLFICSALNALASSYSFSNARILDKIKKEIIKLPSRITVDFSTVELIGGGTDMSKIDTSNWKKFRLGDLFRVVRGSLKIMRKIGEGDIPIIAAARSNNGVAMYADIEPEFKDAITVSCNGVGCGSTFYQKGPFAMNGDAAVLIEKEPMSELSKLGMVAILDSLLSSKYSYEDKCSPEKLENEMVLLPGTEEPDWDYMESYMKKVMEETEEYIRIVGGHSFEKHPVDVNEWGEFRVGDYFEVSYGKFIPQKDSVEDGAIPHITTTVSNNGTGYYVSNPIFKGNSISVASDGNQGASFYQPVPFSASNIVSAVVPHDDIPLNKYNAEFICTLFRAEGKKYSWGGFKYSVDRVRETKLLMPIAPSGEPDWQYMEEYMKAVMEEQEKVVERLGKEIA